MNQVMETTWDIRVGKVTAADFLQQTGYSTHRLEIDFGEEIGQKMSCARLVKYQPEVLVGKLVLGVVNLPPKQVGKYISEVLTLGVPDQEGECILIVPEEPVQPGNKVY